MMLTGGRVFAGTDKRAFAHLIIFGHEHNWHFCKQVSRQARANRDYQNILEMPYKFVIFVPMGTNGDLAIWYFIDTG